MTTEKVGFLTSARFRIAKENNAIGLEIVSQKISDSVPNQMKFALRLEQALWLVEELSAAIRELETP